MDVGVRSKRGFITLSLEHKQSLCRMIERE